MLLLLCHCVESELNENFSFLSVKASDSFEIWYSLGPTLNIFLSLQEALASVWLLLYLFKVLLDSLIYRLFCFLQVSEVET